MSCYERCPPTSCGPTPLANSCNEPCVRQCQDSTVVIQPSPVVVTLPGPILSSFPQNTTVGSSASAAFGSALSAGGVPINSGGSSLGFGGFGGFGSVPGLGSGYSRPYRRYNASRSGFYGPC
ncbi:KRFB protein, partial [Rhodinocichla rosea]|nr:KRFB protein [Rhodinocichla rosea]